MHSMEKHNQGIDPPTGMTPEDKGAGTADLPELSEAEVKEAEYRKAYLEQLRRRSCPGCGEGEAIY